MKFQVMLWVLCLNIETESLTRKFVLQNEMSEHCRRRVVSSIFLGRQVAESSAQVLHFSRLELPYSCSISVRTESGSNIILVILSKSEKSIVNSCAQDHDQLIVYEMGETFGGYWGALPESVFQQNSQNQSTYYTLKTTEPLTETSDTGVTDYDTLKYTEEIVGQTTPQDDRDPNYVVVEVPLVNVSGNVELGHYNPPTSDETELFDLIYDVTPKNGVLYETSLMPLVQFSIWKPNDQIEKLKDPKPRYQLDYNLRGFTPDYRLTFPKNNHRRKFSIRPYYSTRRIQFKKKKNKFFVANNWSKFDSQIENVTKLFTTTEQRNKDLLDFSLYKSSSHTWQLPEHFLNTLNVNKFLALETKDDATLGTFTKISNIQHNISVSVQTNLTNVSKYNNFNSSVTEKNTNYLTENFLNALPLRINDSLQSTKSTYNSSHIDDTSTAKIKLQISTSFNLDKNYVQEFTTTAMLPSVINHQEISGVQVQENFVEEMTVKSWKSESGSLVDHESWENIVQVAPVMADFLNATTPTIDNDSFILNTALKNTKSVKLQNRIHRKKRYIQALSIENHRPQQITKKEYAPYLNRNKEQLDSQRLAQLVELQDDEIQGRLALHYYKNYVGSTIFNMCDYHEVKVRQVYLFNSSRILIAINNFTMDRITIVMTESRVAQATGCPPAHLECQVSGVRVCVHYMNACDGLPNCGAYEIYDEDRLLCGSAVDFHYTVCLAACTFLLLLLTLLYSVHYWLKRCVPKVSQAFFIYTDKSENILYLNSIMRSPTDFDIGSRLVYRSSFFDDDNLASDSIKDDDKKVLNIFRRCLRILFCKKSKSLTNDDKGQNDTLYGVHTEPKRKYSFTEAELSKIGQFTTTNVSVQTGDSLEMSYLREKKSLTNFEDFIRSHRAMNEETSVYSKTQSIHLEESDKELLTLRRIRGISASVQSSSKNGSMKTLKRDAKKYPASVEEEVELQSTLYDRESKMPVLSRDILDRTNYEIHPEPPEEKRIATKHLRFEEGAMTIEPSTISLSDVDKIDKRRRAFLNTSRVANVDLDTNVDDEAGASSSTARDFRRFWGKGKKNKKKTQLSLH